MKRALHLVPLAFGAILIASCASRSTDPDIDAPIFGSSHPTVFVVSPESGDVHVRDLAKVARVLRRYKKLTDAEQALVKSAVGKRLNALISLEVERVNKKYEPQRQAIHKLPDAAIAKKQLADLDAKVRHEAEARVLKQLGSLLAVPLKTSDNRTAVAFAKIGTGGIQVASDAGEVDRPLAQLIEGTDVQQTSKAIATIISTEPVAIASGR